MSIQESFRLSYKNEVALLEWDLFGESANKLNTATMTRFRELLTEVDKSSAKALVMISRKAKIFIAGADIEEIKSLKTPDDFKAAVKGGQDIMNLVEDLRMPVIAAIHGACVGGGCELALACDYRIATDDASTKIGLPEIKLGIIPGFGGCVRMPRVIGLPASLDIILAGKTPPAAKAKKIGLIDRIVDKNLLEQHALKWAEEIIQSGAKKRKKSYLPKGLMDQFLHSFVGRGVVFSQARKGILKQTYGHYPAPLKALEVIEQSYGLSDRSKALAIECAGFAEVATTEISKHLIQLFFMMEDVKKRSGVGDSQVKAPSVESLGVLGAGTMGGGIAFVAADRGIEVRMKDIALPAIGIGLAHASQLWLKLVKKKRLTQNEYQRKMSLVSGGVDFSGFKRLDLVVEAVVEDLNIKKKVIAETAGQVRSDCVIVTNTSSLSVTDMAEAHPQPEYFAGMHFFNPVDKMPLVEVIRGPKTSDQTVVKVFELAKKMGKIPVVVKDGPGFLVNRLLLPYMAEAAFLLTEGMSIEAIDSAFVKKFGMPMGPFALMDEVGLDVCVKVLKIFKTSFGDRVEMPPVMDKLSQSKRLGKKNSLGFYTYDGAGKRLAVDNSVYEELGLSSRPSNPHAVEVCLERCLFAMVNEATRALFDDRIVQSAQDVDMAMIMGTGFPPFRGGLLRYADSLGSEYIANQLEIFAKANAKRLKPSSALEAMAKSNKKFYA